MLEHDIDVALAGDVPDRLAEAPRLFRPDVVFGRTDRGHLAPAFEFLAVDDTLGAEIENIFRLRFIRHDTDGVGARSGDELHAEHAETARGAPDQDIVARFQQVRRMTK